MNRKLKKIGVFLVMIALMVFAGSLFLADYRLTGPVISKSGMNDEEQHYFGQASQDMLNREYSSKKDFRNDLKTAFQNANELILNDYRINQSDIEKLKERSIDGDKIHYSTRLAEELFSMENKSGSSKIKGIRDNTNWMEKRAYASLDEFISNLNESVWKYNNSIISTKGFDEYQVNNLSLGLVLSAITGSLAEQKLLIFFLTFVMGIAGGLLLIIPMFFEGKPGIKNDYIYHKSLSSRGFWGIILGVILTLFYVLLYFYPVHIAEWIYLSGIVSEFLFGRHASQWFFYGLLYTIAILVMGLRFLTKYRQNIHQQLRTYSVMFFQFVFAFILPQILFALNLPEVDLKNIWPLDYSLFYDWRIGDYQQSGAMGMTFFVWAIVLAIIGVPLLTYFYGKRFYCSWVCGCGGLAETAGDPFRQLSSKKLKAWEIERIFIYSILVFAVLMTVWVLYTSISSNSVFLEINSYEVRKVYGFLIGSVFAGVVGTGFYPLMGSRVWCRFGCPLAAYIGIVQRFKSRFRITTNGGQCISCGNCSTYCEMGIDVRWYAQRGQNIIRASCVGCGICSAVCPRGVLKLENKEERGRFNLPVLKGNDELWVKKISN